MTEFFPADGENTSPASAVEKSSGATVVKVSAFAPFEIYAGKVESNQGVSTAAFAGGVSSLSELIILSALVISSFLPVTVKLMRCALFR